MIKPRIDLALSKQTVAWARRRVLRGQIKITLDPVASKLVFWIAEATAREPEDVINGCVAGHIGHIHEQEAGEFRDDSFEHLTGYILESIKRRRINGSLNGRKNGKTD